MKDRLLRLPITYANAINDPRTDVVFTQNQLLAPDGLTVEMQAPLFQMVLEKPISGINMDMEPEVLQVNDVPAMLDLAGRTRPGPFGRRTIEFGRYYGVKSGDLLVAMAGERFRFDQYVEISAASIPVSVGKAMPLF